MLDHCRPAANLDQANGNRDENHANQQHQHLENVSVDNRLQPSHGGVRQDDAARDDDCQGQVDGHGCLDQLAARNHLSTDEGKPCQRDDEGGQRAGSPVEAGLEKVARSQSLYLVCPAFDFGHHQEGHQDDTESRYRDEP